MQLPTNIKRMLQKFASTGFLGLGDGQNWRHITRETGLFSIDVDRKGYPIVREHLTSLVAQEDITLVRLEHCRACLERIKPGKFGEDPLIEPRVWVAVTQTSLFRYSNDAGGFLVNEMLPRLYTEQQPTPPLPPAFETIMKEATVRPAP